MESKEDLELEYTPSLFSRRFPTRDQLLEHFQTFAKSGDFNLFIQLLSEKLFNS